MVCPPPNPPRAVRKVQSNPLKVSTALNPKNDVYDNGILMGVHGGSVVSMPPSQCRCALALTLVFRGISYCCIDYIVDMKTSHMWVICAAAKVCLCGVWQSGHELGFPPVFLCYFMTRSSKANPVQYICLIQRVDVLSLPPKPSTAAIISADYELLLCLNKGALIHWNIIKWILSTTWM